MRSASWMYIPLALSLGAVSLASFANVIEPFSNLVVVVTANCSGLVNSYAYFSNYRVKKELLGSDYDDT
ncbi:hypothetical protein BCR44DRAFT_1441789 [Catenaria anguillulae PL171]|uniref:Uncharacterized protein n=1 Tax=Catenaria anguillulae PL171 TaxID=765915 RepID=A0A1Y2HF73_9FUNG|nr:hypothetical protein BCR44DRAFT_1441789 [Catenaria anguillulae PL171]